MQSTVGAGRIPVDLENGHDSLTRVFPFTVGFRVRVIAALYCSIRKISVARIAETLIALFLPPTSHVPPKQRCNGIIYRDIVLFRQLCACMKANGNF